MLDEENPYASPRYHLDGVIEGNDALDVQVVDVRRSLAWRRLTLAGRSPAIVEYNGRGPGYETVLVNGQVAGRAWHNSWWDLRALVPSIDFQIACPSGVIPARVEARGAFLVFLVAFRLFVDRQIVYSEGAW